MKACPRLRLLALVAQHFLRCGFCYEQVCSIVWCRNDALGCDPTAVHHLCRRALLEHLAEGETMTARTSTDHVHPVPPRFDAPMLQLPLSQRNLLGLAWICEQAARSCEHDGDVELGESLRKDAAAFRARAVDR